MGFTVVNETVPWPATRRPSTAPTGGSGARGPRRCPSDAGVKIYAEGGRASGIQEAINTLKKDEGEGDRAIVFD